MRQRMPKLMSPGFTKQKTTAQAAAGCMMSPCTWKVQQLGLHVSFSLGKGFLVAATSRTQT